jgi:hypothetical protein
LQWTAIIVGLLGTSGALAGGLWRWTLAFTHYGPAVVWRWSLPWFLAALGLSPALILGIYSFWRTRRLSVALFPSGLILRRGGKLLEIPWQEIQSLMLHSSLPGLPLVRAGRPLVLEIRTSQGKELRLSRELERFEELVENIKAKVYPRMHRALAGAFNQGQSLSFGPLTIAPAGLQLRGSTIPWTQVQSGQLKKGRLTIEGRGGTILRLPASRVPNVDLCLQMIESMVQA